MSECQIPPPHKAAKDTKKRKYLTVAQKREIIHLIKAHGWRQRDVAQCYGIGESTVCDIFRNEPTLIHAKVSPSTKRISADLAINERDQPILQRMKRLREVGVPVNGPILCAIAVADSIMINSKDFHATSGWLQCFVERTRLVDRSKSDRCVDFLQPLESARHLQLGDGTSGLGADLDPAALLHVEEGDGLHQRDGDGSGDGDGKESFRMSRCESVGRIRNQDHGCANCSLHNARVIYPDDVEAIESLLRSGRYAQDDLYYMSENFFDYICQARNTVCSHKGDDVGDDDHLWFSAAEIEERADLQRRREMLKGIVFMSCCNASGSVKYPLSFVGCWKKPLLSNVQYKFTPTGWMNAQVFNDWLCDFDQSLQKDCILFVDHTKARKVLPSIKLLHTTVVFLSPKHNKFKLTSCAGIIETLRLIYYKNFLLDYCSRHATIDDQRTNPSENQTHKDISLQDAIAWIVSAWNSISATTLSHAWNLREFLRTSESFQSSTDYVKECEIKSNACPEIESIQESLAGIDKGFYAQSGLMSIWRKLFGKNNHTNSLTELQNFHSGRTSIRDEDSQQIHPPESTSQCTQRELSHDEPIIQTDDPTLDKSISINSVYQFRSGVESQIEKTNSQIKLKENELRRKRIEELIELTLTQGDHLSAIISELKRALERTSGPAGQSNDAMDVLDKI